MLKSLKFIRYHNQLVMINWDLSLKKILILVLRLLQFLLFVITNNYPGVGYITRRISRDFHITCY